MKRIFTVGLLIAAVLIAGCGKKTVVTRVETDSTIDLSGRWNDSDSRLVAQAIVTDCTAARWIGDHVRRVGSPPVVIVGSIRNKTSEHIATEIFVKDLERAFVSGGQVDVVASSDERGQTRDERIDQKVFAAPETVKAFGRELGADYMLIGVINEQHDEQNGKKVIFF
ncbi:penicillin-binding protein activator LpoB, partial [bacterium]|nr:penicillin-binding protein activator LpoB [bacterium]